MARFEDRLRASLTTVWARTILGRTGGDNPPDCQAFISAVGELCPFLGRVAVRDDSRIDRILNADPQSHFSDLYYFPAAEATLDDVKRGLRQCRSTNALAIALADLSGVYDWRETVEALSAFADHAVQVALRVAVETARQQRGVVFDKMPDLPDCGLAILAMGKHGARELNYSSDIDLVAIYEPERMGLSDDSRIDARNFAVKTTQILIDLLSDQTVDGHVHRTDFRLRPNPSATKVAVSIAAAERYYEEYGQNWERAAYIKVRPIAGDAKVADSFVDMIRPFVWRRTLDFGAVADIHAVKKQIHAEKGDLRLEARGADVKLGPGGIREIEFFAQTQQLLLGGREEALRSARTIEAIHALAAAGHVDDDVASQLEVAYGFLRDVEHRLQMREDAQTQRLPSKDADIAVIARLMGYDGVDEFLKQLDEHLRYVNDAYAELFSAPEPASPIKGSLVFTGVDDDPRTITTLSELGFRDPALLTGRVRSWHSGGMIATKSQRARELLTALVPHILNEISSYPDPDTAFGTLDLFLRALPSGIQVFALLTASPEVLDDVLALCATSPSLALQLGKRPALLEGLLDGLSVEAPLLHEIDPTADLEDVMDRVRQSVNEHRVRVAATTALGRANVADSAVQLSDAADRAVSVIVEGVRHDLERSGKNPKGQLVVVGFGRMGVQALTVSSDLDLVFVHEAGAGGESEDVLFTRLVRRVVTALSVPTAMGELFTIDMQLRPSGGAGPTAVSLSAFDQYYAEKAWIWELMALCKARVVAGPPDLANRVNMIIDREITKPRPRAEIVEAVRSMRERLLAEKPPRSPLDAKRREGGLTDIEFIVQGLTLIHGHELGRAPSTVGAATAFFQEHGVLTDDERTQLARAYFIFEGVTQFSRAVHGSKPPLEFTSFEIARLLPLVGLPPETDLMQLLDELSEKVTEIFSQQISVGSQ